MTLLRLQQLQQTLRQAWSDRTSSKWTLTSPAAGQCSVTALVVQDLLGGDLLKTPVGEAWHFYNRVADRIYDFTAEQFIDLPQYLDLPATRVEAMADTTSQQYEALARAIGSSAEKENHLEDAALSRGPLRPDR